MEQLERSATEANFIISRSPGSSLSSEQVLLLGTQTAYRTGIEKDSHTMCKLVSQPWEHSLGTGQQTIFRVTSCIMQGYSLLESSQTLKRYQHGRGSSL